MNPVAKRDIQSFHNYFGRLSPEIIKRLQRVIEHPTQDTWDDAYTIILRSDIGLGLTLWQAWIAIDKLAPRSRPLDVPWPRIPDSWTLRRALRWAAMATEEQYFQQVHG
jgi:hypothetical protein